MVYRGDDTIVRGIRKRLRDLVRVIEFNEARESMHVWEPHQKWEGKSVQERSTSLYGANNWSGMQAPRKPRGEKQCYLFQRDNEKRTLEELKIQRKV